MIVPRLVLLLLLTGAASCAQPAERAAAAHDDIVADLERGDLPQAERRVGENTQEWRNAPRSPWHWRFRLLAAEIARHLRPVSKDPSCSTTT